MGSIKDRNGMDLTEAEGIKKRWQEYNKGQSSTSRVSHFYLSSPMRNFTCDSWGLGEGILAKEKLIWILKAS